MLHYCHKIVSEYGTIDLDAYCILRRSPELFDAQVLLDPLEEQFHAPPVAVELGNCLGRGGQVVGQEDVSGTILRVNTYHFSQFLGVILRAFINREVADGIRDYVRRKSPFPSHRLEPDIGFGPDDEERANAVDCVEIAEIVVAPVEDIMGTVLIAIK